MTTERNNNNSHILSADAGALIFKSLYIQYSPLLYGLILEATTDTKIAERILTESFVEAWTDYHLFKSSGKALYTWLLIITLRNAGKFYAFRLTGMYACKKLRHE